LIVDEDFVRSEHFCNYFPLLKEIKWSEWVYTF